MYSVSQELDSMILERYEKEKAECTPQEICALLVEFTNRRMQDLAPCEGKKRAYYLSMEFLVGRLLVCNLINLGVYEEVEQWLCDAGHTLSQIEELEPEPSLGNGGLGRLAACYLDSAACLGLPVDGVGLCYHFGLFKQAFAQNKQQALPNPWMGDDSWLIPTKQRYEVKLCGKKVYAVMKYICVPGAQAHANRLWLMDIESVDETLVDAQGINFDKTDVFRNLTLFLYPDDSDKEGEMLRICQEYFLASGAAQFVLHQAKLRGSNLHDLGEYAVVQINDTHPSMVIPELVRLLINDGLSQDEAISIVSGMCAYTNHTILAEALEKWPLEDIKKVAPQLVPIIRQLSKRVKERCDDEKLAIIDKNKTVHMAHMDIHYGFSVNGVAALHTEILKNSELSKFYELYPQKFSNKTNGVSFRRWLLACNPALAELIESTIGGEYKKDATHLKKLAEHVNDEELLQKIESIKQQNKRKLVDFLRQNAGVTLPENAIFDIQIKRIHEYKRQQLNALWLIKTYLDIKAGARPQRPIVSIFGGKAAPAYVIAQDVIHLILCLQQLIECDEEVSRYLRVVMVQNYNVSAAERLIPACDISEQISLASKEASGTGNMKFMLNGAVTLGTMDGANVEIAQLVGEDNIYIFGKNSDEVIERYEKKDYEPLNYYAQEEIGRLVDFIVSPELVRIGDRLCLARLHRELIAKDWFMTLPDVQDYFAVKSKMLVDYEDRSAWRGKMLLNIAQAGFFSSDRSVAEYEKDIWHLR